MLMIFSIFNRTILFTFTPCSVRIPMLVWRCFNLNVTYISIIYFAYNHWRKKKCSQNGRIFWLSPHLSVKLPSIWKSLYFLFKNTFNINADLKWKKWHRIKLPFYLKELHMLVMMMINRNSSFYARYLVPVEFTGLIAYHIPTIYLFIVFNNCNL